MPDQELEDRMLLARADLRVATDEIIRQSERLRDSVEQLSGGSVTRIHQEPTAEVALTADELENVLRFLNRSDLFRNGAAASAREKLRQALAIESGPGGRFSGGTAA